MLEFDYYTKLVVLLTLSFGVGLFFSTTRARFFAYAGVVAYVIGLCLGVYYE